MCRYYEIACVPEVFESSDGRNGRTVNDITTVIQHMEINANLPYLYRMEGVTNWHEIHVHVHACTCSYFV